MILGVEVGWLGLWFVVGSIPFGYVLGRLIYHTDIREHGSRNIGATNAARTFGKKLGMGVLVLDGLKGLTGVLWAHNIFVHEPLLIGLTGTMAILGHVFSPFLGFRGGKGVATGFGVALGLNLPLALLGIGVFALAVMLGRIVSVASWVGMMTVVGGLWGTQHMGQLYSFGIPAIMILTWAHRANWVRLVHGQEPKVGQPRH